ncbi:MAG TPA: hypothetical protein VJ894_00015 [Cryomorphaceae bacterium]|nr:hypothetical protein [Cryomorphaceae bacterium]
MKNLLLVLSLVIAASSQLLAQCDSTASYAQEFMDDNFIPDGQSYRALIFDDQLAEFETTFFGKSKYRIAAYTGMEEEQLIFSLYDEENNLLYSNEKHQNSPYWDFEVESTLNVRLEARLDKTKQSSGCAVILIGFEK